MWGAAQRGFAALTRVGLLPTLGKENLAGARNNLGKHVFCLDFGVHLNLQVVVDELVKKYYIEELQSEMKTLYATWDEFPAASPADKGDLPLEDQLVANLLELLKIKLAETGSTDPHGVPPVAPPAAKPADAPAAAAVPAAAPAAEKPAASS